VLRTAGFAVIAVEDGARALEHIEQWKPSAVVLDLALPFVGGRDVHRELKARPDTRHIPVVVVSGTDMSDLDSKSKDFASLLRKPLEPDALVWAVENSIRRARGRSVEPT
jgi:CheY-like chemotaxis protein